MEPTKPPYPADVPSKRKQDDCTEDLRQKSMKTDNEDDALCELCETVDFVAFFTSRCKTVSLGPLSHVFGCLRCPFCKYIAGTVHQKHGHLAQSRKGQLILIQRFLPNQEYIRESGIELLFRLEVWTKRNSQPRLLLTTIEACDGLPEPRYPNVRMIRLPMQARFEINLLQQWLRNTGEESARVGNPQLFTAVYSAKALRDRGKFRVLDVHSGKVLVLRSAERYLALSYVWGQYVGSRRSAMHGSPQDKSEHVAWTVDLSTEPATIRDAALLVRELGERFLWVDSLCIDQEDPLDKAEIISKMDVIYQHAYLTIVAADGEDANAGLRRLHTHAIYREKPISLVSGQRRLSFLPKAPESESTLEQTVWNTRGWTYQEMILSPRIVVFTDVQVHFSAWGRRERESYELGEVSNCKHGRTRQRATHTTKTTQEFLAVSQPKKRMLRDPDAYFKAVQEYTKRSLTYEGDRFDAFNGILSSISRGYRPPRETQALSGILTFSIESSTRDSLFDWHIPGPSHRIPHDKLNTRALPSWSWIGWSGAVNFGTELPFYELVVMNENNIRLNSTNTLVQAVPWPSKPTPCTMTPKEGIVLHMWAPYLRCKLIETTPQQTHLNIPATHRFYSVITASDDAQEPLATVVLDPSLVPSADTDALYGFIGAGGHSTDGWYGRLMLIKRCDNPDFVERVGISQETVTFKHGHPLEFRHIKLL